MEPDFGLGERRLVFRPLLGDGIFTQDGQAWSHSRALLRPAFFIQEQILSVIARAADDLIDQLQPGTCVDLQPLLFSFTLKTTLFMLFGSDDATFSDSKSASAFASAFDEAQDYLARRGRLGPLYWLIDGPHFRKQCAVVHKYIDDIVAKAIVTAAAPGGDKTVYTILGGLVKETTSPRILREQCLNVLLAGRDTTACLLSWAFRLLTRHPVALDKVKDEISRTCGKSTPSRPELKRMTYLNAVLKEVLRLYPSVPVNARTAIRTTSLPVGGGADGKMPILVRKGESVGYCPYAMHRRQDIFGHDSRSFRPERWLEDGGRLAQTVGYGYLPFNAGPRTCLGQEFALLEAGYLIVRILQKHPVMDVPADEASEAIGDEIQKLTLVLAPAGGCRVQLA